MTLAMNRTHGRGQNFISVEDEDSFLSGFGMIPDSHQIHIDIYITTVLLTCTGILGVVTNLINLTVLFKQGVKDCVSVCIISLSFSDLGTSCLTILYSGSRAVIRSGVYYHVDPNGLLFLFSWVNAMFCDISMFTITFVSIERCVCVLLPFHFKNLVTFKRATVVAVFLYVYNLSVYLPAYQTFGFQERWDKNYNRSRVLLWLSPTREVALFYFHIYQTAVANIACQILVIASTYGMIFGLRKSTNFRSQATYQDKAAAATSSEDNSNATKKKMVVVKMVTILAIIFMACNFVRMSVVLIMRVRTEIRVDSPYKNTAHTLVSLFLWFGALNSTVNTFVYYYFKPNFKDTLLLTFGCKQLQEKTLTMQMS